MEWRILDAERLSTLTHRDSGDRWLKTVADAGVERLDADAPPHQAMSALYEAAWALAEQDAQVTELRVSDRFHFYAPPGWWLVLPLLYCLFILLAAFRDDFGDRLMTLGALWVGLGALAVGVLLWISAATWTQRAQKKARLEDARQRRDQAARAVLRARQALLEQAFVLRTRGQQFVAHVPRLRAIQTQLRKLPSSDPVHARLCEERDRLQAALAEHRQQPPAVWTDDGLAQDTGK